MKSVFKKLIASNSFLYKILSKKYRQLFKFWLPGSRQLEEILKKYASLKNNIFFIQIGSNDGVANDPLHEYVVNAGWKGILVEPVKYLFEKLIVNYAKQANLLHFENAAIAENDGKSKFYRLTEKDADQHPFWYKQIGSFNKQVLLSHKDRDNFEDLIIEEDIDTISFSSLTKKYGVDHADLIHIDTEGYDYNILKLIDFEKLQPGIVIYEYVHLSLSDFRKSLKLMRANDYQLYASNLDIVCIQKELLQNMGI